MNRDLFRVEIERDEGVRLKPYRDSEGFLTIGVGWNLDANGLPAEVVALLREIATDRAMSDLDSIEPRWRELSEIRQRVLVNMAYNLGHKRFSLFKRFWAAVREYLSGENPYAALTARNELKDSLWARQVGARAERLIEMWERG